MKPIKLEITGLQSFSKKQTIDFNELTSLGLFGIFGETGSGKSTILDAMIFAIFDEIPRTMGSKGKNIRPCLNQDSQNIEVYFKFSLGEDIFEIDRCYKKKYNRKGEEKFEQSNPILKINGDVIADTVTNVQSKINEHFGISVSDFTRSVVLPQGKFSEFLKLKGSDKMSMLENIFDLEKYGTKMSDKISGRLNILKESINSLQNQIKGKGDFSLELIDTLKSNLEVKNVEHINLIDEKKSLTSEFLELTEVKNLFQKLEFYNFEISKLEEIKEKIAQNKDKISKHEVASSLKSLIEELELLQKDITQNSFDLKNLEIDLSKESESLNLEKINEATLEKNIEKINQQLLEKKIDYDTLDSLRKAVGYLQTIKLKENLLKEVLEYNKSIDEEINSFKERFKNSEAELDTTQKELDSLIKIDPILIYTFEKEISDIKTTLRIESEKILNKSNLEKELEKYLENKNSLLDDFSKINEVVSELQKQTLQNQAFELAQHLKHGDNCPVCGSKEHPTLAQSTHSIDISVLQENIDERNNLEKKLIAIDTKIEYTTKAIFSIEVIENIDLLEESLIQKEIELKSLKEKDNEFSIKERNISKSLATLTSILSNLKENISHREEILKSSLDKASLYENEVLKEKESLSHLNLCNILNNSLEITLDSVLKEKEILESMDKEHRAMLSSKELSEKDLKQIRNNILSVLDKVQSINLEIVTLKEKISNSENSFQEKNKHLHEISLSKGFNSKEEILLYLLNESHYLSLKDGISEFENNYVKYNHLKDELLSEINNRELNSERWESINLSLEDLAKKESSLVKEITELNSDLTRIELLAEEAKELLKEIETLTLKQDDLLLLQKRFKGRKFVNFLARKRLDYITYEASKRLQKITMGRYLLKVDNNCDFIIIDTFNSNHSRDCSTLSGGETFIVSLVLALALSGQLQLKGKIQLEFFFLDEGFGTLDSVLLDRVIEILEEIGWKEKMKIGIISHVEDLKIRIPRRLEVSPAIPGEIGSTIKLI
ncbi:SMC family ATPase [uncultured Cetobacterium sp.]|uniref:AAA family ATPase n=2 Tax=Cetobacterium TaxID=180162 RepID=UPI0025F1E1D6|nr:SMC family ATPase [uncultured Cetobacterium sp.]